MLKMITPAAILMASCLASQAWAAKHGYDCSVSRAQVTPEGHPADGLAGLRLGMSLQDARHVLICERNARLGTDERPPNAWSPLQPLTRRGSGQPALADRFGIIELSASGKGITPSGHGTIKAWFVGKHTSQGFEQARLVRIEQRIRYQRTSAYPMSTAIASVTQTYGDLDTLPESLAKRRAVSAAKVRTFDPTGKLLTPDDDQYEACWRMGSDFHAIRTKYRRPKECGLTVYFEVKSSPLTSQAASESKLAIMNPAKAWEYAIAVH